MKFSMKQGTYWFKFGWCLVISIFAATSFCLTNAHPVAAQSVGGYFQISYDPFSFSKNEIHGSEVFNALIKGKATCTKDLPVSVSEANITWRVVAQHEITGSKLTLNAGYTVSIKPFPSKSGDTSEINQPITLRFPDSAKTGSYKIIGELINAKVKVAFAWAEVTEYLPSTQTIGSIKYISPEATSTPTPPAVPTATPPLKPTPPPILTPTPVKSGISWWVWLIVAIAVATTIANIICLIRYHHNK